MNERDLLLRLRRALDAGRSEDPLPSAVRVPSTEYTDADAYAAELALVARRHPLPFVPSASLGEPGARACKELLGEHLVATRDVDGTVRVLDNRCRHRGTLLVAEGDCGPARRLVCPYHGWTYGLDGSLLHVPEHETGFPDIELSRLSLPRTTSLDLAGMVWACLDGRVPSSPAFDAMREELDGYRLREARVLDVRRWSGAFNWKLGVNGFLETYHFKVAHKDGIAPHFVWNRILVDAFGENLRLTLPRTSLREHLATTPPERWNLRPHASFVYVVFPCSFLSILPDHASFITFLPDGLSRTRVESHIFVPRGSDRGDAYWERNAALFRQTIEEDMALSESIQRGLGRPQVFTFAAFEHALSHFRASLHRIVAGGAP